MIYLTAEQVLFLHARLIDETGGSQGIHDLGRLLSALARPQATFGGEELYPGLFAKAAALVASLIRNHPFVDGNKRTGIAAAALFLLQNSCRLVATNTELETFTLSVVLNQPDIPTLANWFRDHSELLNA